MKFANSTIRREDPGAPSGDDTVTGGGGGGEQGDGDPPNKADPNPNPPAPSATPPEPADWRASIADEKLRKYADEFASPTDLAKGHQELRTMLSQRIKVPGEDATDEDLSKFRKALGVPDNATDYQVAPPEGYEWTDDDQAMFDLVAPIAHAANMPQEALQGFVGAYIAATQEMMQSAEKALETAHNNAEAALKKEWGSEYEANKNLATRFGKMGGEELSAFLNTPVSELVQTNGDMLIGDHPALMKFFGEMGRKTGEGGLQLTADPAEMQTIDARIAEIKKENPVGSPGYGSEAVQGELRKLYERKAGAGPIVGAEGRSY